MDEIISPASETVQDDDLPHKLINDAQLELLFSEKAEKYTDAKVTCKGKEWKVQQSILCPRCPFFEVCFRTGTFKEGETKIVDFKDDEPYAVEGLLIYLYTFEYPNRKSHKFEEPESNRLDRNRYLARKRIRDGQSICITPKQQKSNTTGFKLKSFAPEDAWQERLAIYHIAHRMDLQLLCKASLAFLTKDIDAALGSTSVGQFLRKILDLPSSKTEDMRKIMATKIANQVPRPILSLTLDGVLLVNPRFSRDLIEAMRDKDLQQREEIAGYNEKIEAVQQIVWENWPAKRTYNALRDLTSRWSRTQTDHM